MEGLPAATRREVERLRADGYTIHKLWANGVELRKGPAFNGWKLTLHLLLVMFIPLLPFVLRSLVNNVYGYRFRVLVSLDETEPHIRFV